MGFSGQRAVACESAFAQLRCRELDPRGYVFSPRLEPVRCFSSRETVRKREAERALPLGARWAGSGRSSVRRAACCFHPTGSSESGYEPIVQPVLDDGTQTGANPHRNVEPNISFRARFVSWRDFVVRQFG